MTFSYMIVDNFDVRRTGVPFYPLETNPPLVIDADTVSPLAVSLESLETISRQRGQIF